MKYNTFDELQKVYYRLEKDEGVSILPVTSETVIVKEKWYALVESTGEIKIVAPKISRDYWMSRVDAPCEVKEFFEGGETLGFEGAMNSENVRRYRKYPCIVSAIIGIKKTVACNKIALCYNLEYDCAEWSEILRFPITDKQIEQTIRSLKDASLDWMADNGLYMDEGGIIHDLSERIEADDELGAGHPYITHLDWDKR